MQYDWIDFYTEFATKLLPFKTDTIDDSWLYGVVEYELIPLLKEYWFDEPMKVKDWSENLRSTIK